MLHTTAVTGTHTHIQTIIWQSNLNTYLSISLKKIAKNASKKQEKKINT